MLPTREKAEMILQEAENCNPGNWANHSRVTAYCAEKIAENCADMDGEKAYIVGLLHDIGRKFGNRQLGHICDGYSYMMSLGYDEVARVCMSHSFNNHIMEEYMGKFDATEEEFNLMESTIKSMEYDDYDRLIQLCDALGGVTRVTNVEERMEDVRSRYGWYPPTKWDSTIELKGYFEEKTGQNLYIAIDKDGYNAKNDRA